MNTHKTHYSEGILVLLVACVITAFCLGNLPIADRSVWVDEAMLLSNFWSDSALNLFAPLPYYDQSAPPLPTFLLNLAVKLFGTNIMATRYCVVVIVLLSLTYLLIITIRYQGLYCAVVIALLSIGSWQLIYYSSELKHYGFEISGAFLITGWVIQYFSKQNHCIDSLDACLLLTGLALGFSTLFPFLCVLLLIAARKAITSGFDLRINPKSLLVLLVLLICGILYKFVIDYYSQFQIQSNFDVYQTEVNLRNIKRLIKLSDPLLIAGAILGFLYLAYCVFVIKRVSPKTIFDDSRLAVSLFGLITMGMVVLAGLIGLYPAIAPRQMVWLLPIAITIIAFVTTDKLNERKSTSHSLVFLIGALIGLNFMHSVRHLIDFEDHNANNALYSTLSKQEPGTVLLHFAAQPSFDIYKDVMPELLKHRYIGRFNRENGSLIEQSEFSANYADYIESTPGAYSSMVYFRQNKDFDVYSEWAASITQNSPRFYVVLSHYKDYLRQSFIDAISERNCRLKTIFTDIQVELLEAQCDE